MSTKNNAAQTLFRFVSLRNPQLTETKRVNFGFIHRPENIEGEFDEAVANKSAETSKLQALNSIGSEFGGQVFTTVEELEASYFSEMLQIGRKISKREILNDQDRATTDTFYRNILTNPLELTELLKNLWDNMIYQVVSQKDFYVKEAISQILKAIHLGYVQNVDPTEEIIKINGENPLDNALNSKIVMPKELFVEEESTANSNTPSAINPATLQRLKYESSKNLTISKALQKKLAAEHLKSEMAEVERQYFNERKKAYNEAQNAYQAEYGEQISAYETLLAEIESTITEETPREEAEAMYAQLKDLEVPPFDFEFKNEINIEDLQTKLSPESFDLFMELFTNLDYNTADVANLLEAEKVITSDSTMQIGEQTLEIDDSYQSYFSVAEKLHNLIAEQAQYTLDNSPLPQQQYTTIGGALIPVAQTSSFTHLAYTLYVDWSRRVFFAGNETVNFSFEVENSFWSVASAKISGTSSAGQFSENYGAISVQNNKITFPANSTQNLTGISALKLEIYFANGRESTLEIQNVQTLQLYTGILSLKSIRENNPTEGESGSTPRKNFGIKRLGIADYQKVVQSVHAYVPGEVSNIENVMASELRHKSSTARDYSEITDTTSKSQETEKISDTSKTSRTDMQTEVAKELDKLQSVTAHTRYSFEGLNNKFEIGADYANNTAQHDSTRQAVMKSQEITERAMERVLTKISEERVQKIIKEYTETNVHEFDNRGKVTDTDNPDAAQPKHITGVYRWIDKKMKNQIYNYGKRTMFEFMVPEPAKLHKLALSVANVKQLTAPVDPRRAPESHTMANPKMATKELLEYWAGIYGVTLTALLPLTKDQNVARQDFGLHGDASMRSLPITIMDNYTAKSVKIMYGHNREKHHNSIFGGGNKPQTLYFSNFNGGMLSSTSTSTYVQYKEVGYFAINVTGVYDYNFRGDNLNGSHLAFSFKLQLSDAYLDAWKTENFNTIIATYEKALQEFKDAQAALEAEHATKEGEAKENQGNFYRYMEVDVLKHNCIAYLLQDYLNILGQDFTDGDTMDTFQVYLNENLDKYTALAKFMEQAMEWEIMDYTFYPYYWGNRAEWQAMYVSESVDPLFRSFLQAGMARVIVTVKPGFEDAVQFFLTTGKIWNGGEIPVIGDPMYMSIAVEMREPTGKAQGKYWITRIPTTLTILQDKSTGLAVEEPLPIFPEGDPDNCENPMELETETSFRTDDVQLLGSGETNSTIS
ncbi:hypothetical protein P0M11_11435 [Kaistella sp. PBT33-4]|uniref:hypothetical protein n=1 Tax=Kaistella sp. PBT33-4 TaxID=3032000 RepID=UPI0023D7E714|nr:hypothetical protein [Kaistella sp. PBT33-4]MDF0720610.1 hypothetical protein [Kaistella sp. PBT33-4]